MKKKLSLLLACFSFIAFQAQTVTPVLVSNNGGYSSLPNGSISWSIGEPISETYNGPNQILTMGFHQPEISVSTLIQEQGNESEILVFPNPVRDELTLNLSGLKSGKYDVSLNDVLGKLIYKTECNVEENSTTFKMKMLEMAAGNYFIRVNNSNYNKTVKITKVN